MDEEDMDAADDEIQLVIGQKQNKKEKKSPQILEHKRKDIANKKKLIIPTSVAADSVNVEPSACQQTLNSTMLEKALNTPGSLQRSRLLAKNFQQLGLQKHFQSLQDMSEFRILIFSIAYQQHKYFHFNKQAEYEDLLYKLLGPKEVVIKQEEPPKETAYQEPPKEVASTEPSKDIDELDYSISDSEMALQHITKETSKLEVPFALKKQLQYWYSRHRQPENPV